MGDFWVCGFGVEGLGSHKLFLAIQEGQSIKKGIYMTALLFRDLQPP